MTGFHKRKVERKQKAAEKAKEKAHKERLEERKRIREERKSVIASDLKRFEQAMKEIQHGVSDNEEDGEEKTNSKKEKLMSDDSSDFSDWDGIKDTTKSNGILRKKQRYEDDEGITTVTVEDLDPEESQHGIDSFVDLGRSEEVLKQSLARAQYAGNMMERSKVVQQKKKKFRYLTKTERKQNVKKERARSKEKKVRAKSR